MDIIIPLPQIDFSSNTYAELKSYLKQFELAIHHAQKAVESAEADKVEITSDAFVQYKLPSLENSTRSDGEKENNEGLKNFSDNYYDEMQNIELVIHIK